MQIRLIPALAAAALLLLPVTAPAAPKLSAADRVMVSAVDAAKARDLVLLEKLVNQNSGSRNMAGVKAVADMVRPEFEALGFTVRWMPMESTGRAGHLIATHNVGLIAGGAEAAIAADQAHVSASGKTNIIPAKAIARGDLRTLSPEQNTRAQQRMVANVSRAYPGAKAVIRFEDGYPPMAPTEGNRALLARLNTINVALGLPAMAALDPMKRGVGDISFVAADLPGLVGLGLASTGDHTPAETVDLPSLWLQAKRAALLMSRLAAEKR